MYFSPACTLGGKVVRYASPLPNRPKLEGKTTPREGGGYPCTPVEGKRPHTNPSPISQESWGVIPPSTRRGTNPFNQSKANVVVTNKSSENLPVNKTKLDGLQTNSRNTNEETFVAPKGIASRGHILQSVRGV